MKLAIGVALLVAVALATPYAMGFEHAYYSLLGVNCAVLALLTAEAWSNWMPA